MSHDLGLDITDHAPSAGLVCSTVNCDMPAVTLQRLQPYEKNELVARCKNCQLMFNLELALIGNAYQHMDWHKKIKLTIDTK